MRSIAMNQGNDDCRVGIVILHLLIMLILASNIFAQEWPCFHGPARTNISRETGLLNSWPTDGPKLIQTIKGCGIGYSIVSISQGRIYTTGIFDRQVFVLAFDLDGKLLWKALNMDAGQTIPSVKTTDRFLGAKSTPTVHDGMVYHLNEMGRLAAFDAITGKEIWNVNIKEKFDGTWSMYGYAESVLIEGGRLHCQPGGSKAILAALHAKTGKTIWTNTTIQDTVAAYTSPLLVEDRGIRQLITMTPTSVVSVNPETGKTYWTIPHANRDLENIETPVYDHGIVGVSSGYGKGFDGIQLTYSGNSVTAEKIWSDKKSDNLHGGLIVRDGYVYGPACIGSRWFCIHLATGEVKWRDPGVRLGSQTWADGMFYCLSHKGILGLVKATPESYTVVSQVQLPEDGQDHWFAHPVVCGGRLYIRHGDFVYVYDVRGNS